MSEPYRHKEATVLIEMKERDVQALQMFFGDLTEIQNGEKMKGKPLLLTYYHSYCETSQKHLESNFDMAWDLWHTYVDFEPLINAIKKSLDEARLVS